MSFLLLQTFLLMAAAYFLGAFIGCLWRRVIYTAPEVVRESHASEAALAPAGGIELPAAAKPAIARQPEIEYVAPKGGVSDATRFERALSGSGMLGTHAVTPPVTPPPKPAPAVVVAKPVDVKPVAAKPADIKVTEAKPVDVKPAAPVVPVVPAAAPVAKPVTTAAPIVAAPPKPAAAVPVTPAAPIAPAAAVAPPKADTEPPTLVTTPLQKPAASAPSSEAVSVAAAVAAAAAASAAIKAAAKPAEPAAPAPVSAKPAQPAAPAAAKPAAPPAQPTVNIKPAPAAHGVPVSSSGGMSGAVADVRVGPPPAPKPPAPKPAETAPQKAPVPAPAPAAAPAAAERQDLTLVRGIDARAQYLLNARGIYRYADIAKWKQGDVDQLNAALGAPRRIEREGWIEQASVLAAGGFTEYARQRLRGEIADTGAKPAAPAASAAPAKPAVEAPKPAVVAAAPAAVVAAAAAVAPAAKAAPAPAAKPAAEHQDLQLIRGLDEAAQRLLHERGITRYADIARWKSVDVDRFNSALGTPGRIEREGWIEQASVLASGTMTDYARRRLRGEFAVAPRPQAPLAAKPASASAPPPVAAVVKAPPAASPAAAAPKPQAIAGEAVAAAVAAAAAAAPRGAAAAPRPAAAAPSAASAPAPAPVPPAPRPTAAAPAGDMLQRVRGIDAATERLLHTNGVTRYRQIASWTAGDIEQFDALLASPGRIQRENWVEQASILAGSGDTAAADAASRPARLADAIRENTDRTPRAPRPDVGALRSVRSEALRPATGDGARSIGGARAPGAADDLKRIRGIGVLIEKKLNALGVSSYEQVANWTVADIERVSEQLDFRGRIERENWIEQARILSAGGQTEFSRRVDRGEVQ